RRHLGPGPGRRRRPAHRGARPRRPRLRLAVGRAPLVRRRSRSLRARHERVRGTARGDAMTTVPLSPEPSVPGCGPVPESRAMGAGVAGVVATALKALAEPLRLRMLSFIATTPADEACVCDLAALADVSQPTVSHHLKVLRDAGILRSERR